MIICHVDFDIWRLKYWNPIVAILPNFLSLVAREVIITKILSATGGDKAGIMITRGFQWKALFITIPNAWAIIAPQLPGCGYQ